MSDKKEDFKKKAEEYLNGWKRCKADFENYKKEEGERMERCSDFVKEEMLLELLKIYDNFERAESHIKKKDSDWVKGISLIKEQLYSFLKEQGLEEIESLGCDFDPCLHEAVEEVKGEEGKVIEVVEKGYLFKDRVLRPSKVKVGK